jgi:ubiquinone/menaquinone biosynthesis C-methylase UbiE
MSLTGRRIIDRLKHAVSGYLIFPAPPAGNPIYWERVYRSVPPDDCVEWGGYAFQDLQSYEYSSCSVYKTTLDPLNGVSKQPFDVISASTTRTTTSLGETIAVHPHAPSEEPILIVGCGNSKLGEDMLTAGWKGPVIQVDVAGHVIETMRERWTTQQQQLQQQGTGDENMQFVEDDATALSAFPDKMIKAALDKGLLDSLFCANEYEQCFDVMRSVHRVLQPGGVFCCLSLSRPEFLLEKLLLPPPSKTWSSKSISKKDALSLWDDIQIQRLDWMILYRFQKGDEPLLRKGSTKDRRR